MVLGENNAIIQTSSTTDGSSPLLKAYMPLNTQLTEK